MDERTTSPKPPVFEGSWHEELAGGAKGAPPTNALTKPNLINSEVRAEQAASKKLPTLKLGLDVHADSIVVVRLLENSPPQPA